MSIFKIHELRSQDSSCFRTVVNYCREIFHCSGKELDSLGKMLAGDQERVKAHVIYAECLGEMAGFIIFYYYPQKKVAFVEALAVLDSFRNQGIGSELYWRMVELLREQHPECIGHILEMCQDKDNCLKRKQFFLKQGCIPIDLTFFFSDPQMAEIKILYHPYRVNQQYSLGIMEDILKEIGSGFVH